MRWHLLRWINRGMIEKARQDLETNITIEAKQKNRGEHDITRLRSPTEDTICLKYSIIIVRRTFGSGFIEPLKFVNIIWGVLAMISNYHYLSRTNFLKRSFSYRGAGCNDLEPRKSFNTEPPRPGFMSPRDWAPHTKTAGCHNRVEVVVV